MFTEYARDTWVMKNASPSVRVTTALLLATMICHLVIGAMIFIVSLGRNIWIEL